MNDRPKLYRRSEVPEYLRENYGLKYASTTLAKLACLGGGPKFRKAGHTPLYPADELDAWAQAKLSPIVASTSELNSPEAA